MWSVSRGSRDIAAAKLEFSPFSAPCGGTVSDSFVRAILIEFGHMSCILSLNVLHRQWVEGYHG